MGGGWPGGWTREGAGEGEEDGAEEGGVGVSIGQSRIHIADNCGPGVDCPLCTRIQLMPIHSLNMNVCLYSRIPGPNILDSIFFP
jgi:hypothetical protein